LRLQSPLWVSPIIRGAFNLMVRRVKEKIVSILFLFSLSLLFFGLKSNTIEISFYIGTWAFSKKVQAQEPKQKVNYEL